MKPSQYSLFISIAAVVLILVASYVPETEIPDANPSPNTELQVPAPGYHLVTRVVDGDTFEITGGTPVRVLGLDTPETVAPRKPVQCFGAEASQRAKALLLHNAVLLVTDDTQANTDRYDRLVRTVILPSGEDYALTMIADGYGYEYTYRSRYANQARYRSAEAEAAEAARGLWSPSTCNGKRE